VAEPKAVEPKPAPNAVAKQAEPPPAVRREQPVPAKPAVDEKPAAKPAAEKPAPAKPEKAPAAEKPAAAAKPAVAAKPEPRTAATEQDRAIAAAVQRRAEQVKGAASEVDQRIAAAVQRSAAQVATAKETAAAGAVIGSGPGTDTGGVPADLQYILYQGKMNERIKAAWAWAGADRTLHAVVQFNITPEGEVRNVRTVETSGDATFDASAERAVRAVNPLDAVPEKHRAAFATVEITFRASDLES
jgi:colicin import membrane protein